eukprot:CAMPEP_0170484586 /NCGR_PEP_ID=MMETSP0208-20121228/4003_1 /TAXON_ID=197538 /ORGANISM="Strombidium inclinatum, Strain S3" /LENGTH=54 /DNA_ID=CAMNT_0010757933 /DNA_START=9 /DNA_END=173 /DNA_ORIENTATION=-
MTDHLLKHLSPIKKVVEADPVKYTDVPFKERIAPFVYEITVDDPLSFPLTIEDI